MAERVGPYSQRARNLEVGERGKPYGAGGPGTGSSGRSAEAIAAFIAGKASAADVGALTFFFKGAVSQFFPDPCTGDSLVFRELLVTVWNRILLRFKNGKPSSEQLVEIGFMLRRVWVVADAYKAKQAQYTIGEWVEKLVGIAKEAGVPVPG